MRKPDAANLPRFPHNNEGPSSGAFTHTHTHHLSNKEPPKMGPNSKMKTAEILIKLKYTISR
jgi:hypothetical protein